MTQASPKKQQVSLEELNKAINTKEINADSIRTVMSEKLNSTFIPLDSTQKNKILDEIEKQAKDTTNNRNRTAISFGGATRFDEFVVFHQKYPNINVDDALDSLGYTKNFKNRFIYDRAKVSGEFFTNRGSGKKFLNQMLSYASVSLFILLPIFTLFLKFFYIRRKFTYVEHLIFVFHTQTVFFLLLIIFVLLDFFTQNAPIWVFTILFLIYLFLAMKKFYGQGFFKTFIKYILVNWVYMFLATIGIIFVGLISFLLI